VTVERWTLKRSMVKEKAPATPNTLVAGAGRQAPVRARSDLRRKEIE